MINFRRFSFIIFMFAILCSVLPEQSLSFAFTTQENFSVSTVNPTDQDIVENTGASAYRVIQQSLSALLPAEVDIDALDFIDPSNVVFSLMEDANIPGAGQVADEDLLHYNGSVISLLFDGSSANLLPPETDIDAVDVISLSPLEFSFSIREGANLLGVSQVSRNDAIRYVQSFGFVSTDFNGTTAGIPLETNVDGFSRPDGSNFTISLAAAATISSTNYGKSDLINYNIGGGTFSSFFSASANSIPEDVNIQDIESESAAVPVELSEFVIE